MTQYNNLGRIYESAGFRLTVSPYLQLLSIQGNRRETDSHSPVEYPSRINPVDSLLHEVCHRRTEPSQKEKGLPLVCSEREA